MGADLVIHVVEGVFSEEDLRRWFSHIIGSRYCPLTAITEDSSQEEVVAAFDAQGHEARDDLWERWGKTDQVFVGVRSAGATPPPLVDLITDLFGPHDTVVSDEILAKVRKWNEKENRSGYRSAVKSEVLAFLEANKGKRVACVAW
ncbi:MAG: hypothetical protein WC114_09260 [Smithellaceae bacterium]|jgi:hypothetical protein